MARQDLRNKAYAQMMQRRPQSKSMPFAANADDAPLPMGVTPEQNKMLVEKKIPRGLEQGAQSPMGRPDLQPKGSLTDDGIANNTTDTAQKILANKQAAVVKKEEQKPGIDWGAIGKSGLDLLGQGVNAISSVPTSNLVGIAAGTEAGSKNPNVYLASAYGQKSGELSGMELKEKEAEANRNLEVQKIAANMLAKQQELSAEDERKRQERAEKLAEKSQDLQLKEAEKAEELSQKNYESAMKSKADLANDLYAKGDLTPTDYQKVLSMTPEEYNQWSIKSGKQGLDLGLIKLGRTKASLIKKPENIAPSTTPKEVVTATGNKIRVIQ